MTQIFAPDLFDGKAFLVTGAGGGVGSAVARLLSHLGARLAITDINAPALAATAAAPALPTTPASEEILTMAPRVAASAGIA